MKGFIVVWAVLLLAAQLFEHHYTGGNIFPLFRDLFRDASRLFRK